MANIDELRGRDNFAQMYRDETVQTSGGISVIVPSHEQPLTLNGQPYVVEYNEGRLARAVDAANNRPWRQEHLVGNVVVQFLSDHEALPRALGGAELEDLEPYNHGVVNIVIPHHVTAPDVLCNDLVGRYNGHMTEQLGRGLTQAQNVGVMERRSQRLREAMVAGGALIGLVGSVLPSGQHSGEVATEFALGGAATGAAIGSVIGWGWKIDGARYRQQRMEEVSAKRAQRQVQRDRSPWAGVFWLQPLPAQQSE